MNCLAYNGIASTTYAVSNIGTGDGVFAGDSQIGDVVTFELKSLIAGDAVNIASDSNSITISSSGVDTLNNVGGGASIGQSIASNTINLRTLIGTGPISVTQNSNDITIASGIMQSTNNSIIYNYGQTVAINLAASYNSPTPVISNIGTMDQESGTIVPTGPTTANYIPSPRNKKVAFFTFTTTNSSATINSIAKIFPNIQYANDPADYFLASGADGLLYQIAPGIAAENRMVNYDSTLVGLANLSAIALDIADNLLFYTQTTNPNNIRVYDFSTKADAAVLTANLVNGWTAGAVVADLCFCECSSTLYAKGDTAASRILAITIKPYNHVPPVRYDVAVTYLQPYTLTGGVNFSMAVTDNDDLYFAVRPSIGNSQVNLSIRIGGGTAAFLATGTPEANTGIRKLVIGASGTLYCYSATTNVLFRVTPGNSVGNGFATVKTLTRGYRGFARTPYGIAAI